VTLIRPEAVPATLLILTIPLVAIIALRERNSIDVRGFLLITAGRIPGTLAGVLILVVVPASPFVGFSATLGIVGMRGLDCQSRFQRTEKWEEVCIVKCFDGGKVRNGGCQHRDAV
jgi:uncharacterized membrane protein YfcA